MLKIHAIAYLLCLVISDTVSSDSSELWYDGCDPNVVVSYRLTLETYWTEEGFPKSYPKFRPPAQWSKIFGQSHNADYKIFSIDEAASSNVRRFAEKGDVGDLINPKCDKMIFDQFTSPAIGKGFGESQQDFFVNNNHSKISIICKMIPSPDWFIGINGYDLCNEGQWIEAENITMDILDSGTQGGFTFTSPRWRLTEPENITKITSKHPSHEASSFYYPDLNELPVIAKLFIKKIKEHQLFQEITENITYTSENSTYYETTTDINEVPVESIELSIENKDILYKLTESHKLNLKYYPKIFRQKIVKKKPKSKPRISGDLLKSRLPTNIKIPKVTSFYNGW